MTGDPAPRYLDSDGLRLSYTEVGSGPETVVFSHSFLVDSRQFEAQIEALAPNYRVIAYDHRDHGGSERATSPYGLYDLIGDGERVIEALDAAPCHWVGLSTGGFVGMRIALRHPDWLRSVTLMDTSAEAEEPHRKLRLRATLMALRVVGIRPLIGQAMKTMFSDRFLDSEHYRGPRETWRTRILANDPEALIRFGKAIAGRDDVLEDLRALDLPVQVIAGEHDRGLSVKHARALAAAVPGAKLSIVTGAGHLCTIEAPTEVNDVLVPFIEANRSAG